MAENVRRVYNEQWVATGDIGDAIDAVRARIATLGWHRAAFFRVSIEAPAVAERPQPWIVEMHYEVSDSASEEAIS